MSCTFIVEKAKSKSKAASKERARQAETGNSHVQRKGNFSLLNIDSNGILPPRSSRLHSIRPWVPKIFIGNLVDMKLWECTDPTGKIPAPWAQNRN